MTGVGDDRSAAEQVVARLDSYTQEEHEAGITAARQRATARRARARAAAKRLDRDVLDFGEESA